MRCGRFGHKAQNCPQGGKGRGPGKGIGVGLVYTNWTDDEAQPLLTGAVTEHNTRAIVDCGASESIVGALTLQRLHSELEGLSERPSSSATTSPVRP